MESPTDPFEFIIARGMAHRTDPAVSCTNFGGWNTEVENHMSHSRAAVVMMVCWAKAWTFQAEYSRRGEDITLNEALMA